MKKVLMVFALFGMLFLTACDMDEDPADDNNNDTTYNTSVDYLF